MIKMIIDAYTHILPRNVASAMKTLRKPFEPGAIEVDNPRYYDPEARLKHMEKFGVDMNVITLIELGHVTNHEELVKLYKIGNDGLAKICEKYPEKFVGVAGVPLGVVNDAIDELDRAIQELGLKGVEVFSNIGGKPLDSPEFLPFYAKVVKYDIPIFLHPATWSGYKPAERFNLNLLLGWPFDTSIAMATLVLGGIFDKYPSLKIITHHVGAMIPTFITRFNEVAPRSLVKTSKPLKEYFQMFYADTVTYGNRPALMTGHEFFGPDHLLFGTDYPWPLGSFGIENIKMTIEDVSALPASEEDKSKIFEGNARKLLKLG